MAVALPSAKVQITLPPTIKYRLDRIHNRRAGKIARIFPVLDSLRPHLTPQPLQDLLFTLADVQLAYAPFPGVVVFAAALPEELASEPAVEFGQLLEGMSHAGGMGSGGGSVSGGLSVRLCFWFHGRSAGGPSVRLCFWFLGRSGP